MSNRAAALKEAIDSHIGDGLAWAEVLKFVEEGKKAKRATPDAFTDIWKRVDAAISGVLDRTTFAELVRRWKEMQTRYVPNWEI